MKLLTLTYLRENIFKVFDQVITSGVPQEVERKGKMLQIRLKSKINKLDNLVPHDVINIDPEELVDIKLYSWKEPEKI